MTENEALKRMKMCIGVSPSENIISSFKLMSDALDELQQYRAIGTVEGYEKAIQATTEYYLLMKEYKSKVQDFEAIGTVEEFKALKEKNVAKKPIERKRHYLTVFDCPICNAELFSGQRYCDECGQPILDDYE